MRFSATRLLAASSLALLAGCAAVPPSGHADRYRQQVLDTERAFASTLANRDYPAFMDFLSDEAIFFTGDAPLHGKTQVAQQWQRYFEKPEAPFSWQPERVEVLQSGELALSSGPVRDPQGRLIGSFTSIWRQEAPGVWRIIFDKGCEACDCPKR